VDLLAVTPTNLTVVDIRKIDGVREAVVRVPQNWREPWYVEAADGTRHQLPDDLCDRADRSIAILRRRLDDLTGADDQPASRRMKYLILFPDDYSFEGPKEYFIVERREVLTLQLINWRDLPAAILATTQKHRLDSRSCRSWVEGAILKKTDDSIFGTWLDPVFDEVESEAPNKGRRRLGDLWRKSIPTPKQTSSSDGVRPTLVQAVSWRPFKLAGMLIAGLAVAMVGWRLSDGNRSATSHQSISASPSEAVDRTAPLSKVAEVPEQEIVANTEVSRLSERGKLEFAKHDRSSETSSKPFGQANARKDLNLKRQKLELQIEKAIRRRAIAGVSVDFVGDTAHLKGRVATENQKAAAEKAARGVPGVKKLRSSIEIRPLLSGES
jgi:hypothetical protein